MTFKINTLASDEEYINKQLNHCTNYETDF